MNQHITQVFFSPGETTKQVSGRFASALGGDTTCIDLLAGQPTPQQFGTDDILVAAMPVFAGRIPKGCAAMLQKLKGADTPAVIIAVYGNRHYDDAILELSELLQQNGFIVIGAAAVIARHSIFPQVAAGRPDAQDNQSIAQFAQACKEKLEKGASIYSAPLTVPGNHPYRETQPLPIKPAGKKSTCTRCNACVKICPTQAISAQSPTKTDQSKCITCMACVYHCPPHSRALRGFPFKIAQKSFGKKCAARRQPEFFV